MTTPTTPEQQREQIAALIDESHRTARTLDELWERIESLESRVATAEGLANAADDRARRAEDAARDAGYTADDARSAGRGW